MVLFVPLGYGVDLYMNPSEQVRSGCGYLGWLVQKQLKPDGCNMQTMKHTISLSFATQANFWQKQVKVSFAIDVMYMVPTDTAIGLNCVLKRQFLHSSTELRSLKKEQLQGGWLTGEITPLRMCNASD